MPGGGRPGRPARRRVLSSWRNRWRGVDCKPLWATLLGSAIGAWPIPLVAIQEDNHFDPFSGRPLPVSREVEIRPSLSGKPELTNPRTVLADSNHVYILDPAAYGVHRFDLSGAWLNTIGNHGEGPGEFRRPSAMGWVADTLWVADPRLGRLSFFDSDGAFLRSIRFSVVYGSALAVPTVALEGGRIASVPMVSAKVASEVDSLPVLAFDEEGIEQDTLAWLASGTEVVTITISAANDNSGHTTTSLRHPLDRRNLMTYAPTGSRIFVGTWRPGAPATDGLELLQISAAGDTVVAEQLPLGRRALPPEAVTSFAQRAHRAMPESFRARVSNRALERAFLQQIPHPAATPVNAMIASEAGIIWFRASARTASRSERWAAYRPGHGFLGFVELPPDHFLLSAAAGLLWTRSDDELGLPTITGWRPLG